MRFFLCERRLRRRRRESLHGFFSLEGRLARALLREALVEVDRVVGEGRLSFVRIKGLALLVEGWRLL